MLVLEVNSRNMKISKTLKFVQDGESIVWKSEDWYTMGISILHLVSLELMKLYGITMAWPLEALVKMRGDFDKFSNEKMMKNKGKVLTMVVYARI